MNLFAGSNQDADTGNRLRNLGSGVGGREGKGGTNAESSVEACMLPYIEWRASGVSRMTRELKSSAQGQPRRGGMEREVGGRFRGGGAYVYPWQCTNTILWNHCPPIKK